MAKEQGGKTPLQNLSHKLYTRGGARTSRTDRGYLHPNEVDAPHGWIPKSSAKKKSPREKMPLITKLFFASVVFFIASFAVTLIVFIGGSNVVSSKNVSIALSGPSTIEAGSAVTLQILIENNNDVALEFIDLIIIFPEGTRSTQSKGEELRRTRTSLDTIQAGATASQTISAIFFGQQGSTKELALELEYRTEGSNAIFVASKTHEITITESPINLTVESLKETSSGQEIPLTLVLRGNGEEVINDLLLRVEYPFGYTFIDATPSPSFGDSVWRIGDLPPGGEREITIRGILDGQDGEEKVFRIESGAQSSSDARTIGVVYNSWLSSILIGRPFLGLQFRLNGSILDEYSVASEQELRAQIEWVNNTPAKITNAEIEIKLSGEVLDKATVSVEKGIYRSSEDTILWTGSTNEALREIEPGRVGSVNFSFSSRSLFPQGGSLYKSPTIHMEVSARGERLSEEGVGREITSVVSREIRFVSNLALGTRALYFDGPFANRGGIPPRKDNETTYTIVWSVVNSSNTVSNAKVRATLPEKVRWMGVATPSSEKISYDERQRSVVWDLGVIRAGAGVGSDPREVSFQVGLTPSINDVGERMMLINETEFSGSDEFAEVRIQKTNRALDTNLFSDPQYVSGQGTVIE
ncbi:MAG: hypothetical protein WD003_02760 [Candidatus Paceibacterota bacterium]